MDEKETKNENLATIAIGKGVTLTDRLTRIPKIKKAISKVIEDLEYNSWLKITIVRDPNEQSHGKYRPLMGGKMLLNLAHSQSSLHAVFETATLFKTTAEYLQDVLTVAHEIYHDSKFSYSGVKNDQCFDREAEQYATEFAEKYFTH